MNLQSGFRKEHSNSNASNCRELIMSLSSREKNGLCFFVESSDAVVEMKKVRFVDLLKEEHQDMTKIGEGRENSSSLPSSMRSLLRRLLSSLTPRRGFVFSVAFSSKRKRNAEDEAVLVRNVSKTLLGSLAHVAPQNEESSEFTFARVDHKQRMSGEWNCKELLIHDHGREGELESLLPSDSNDKMNDVCPLPPREAGNSGEAILDDSHDNVAIYSTSADRTVFPGRYIDEMSFNMGVGVGLAFLTANSKIEFDKLKELRTEMEILLKDIKSEMQRKHVISSGMKSNDNNNLMYFGSTSDGVECTQNHLSIQTHGTSDCFKLEHPTMKCEGSKTGPTDRSTKNVGFDQLEAELEAELERLQLKLDAEDISECPGQQCAEIFVKNAATARSISPCSELDYDSQESNDRECNGVSPHKLAKKLHELLETRQQEQIAELESALEYTERKLHEKEMEICWWKENVQFLLHHKG